MGIDFSSFSMPTPAISNNWEATLILPKGLGNPNIFQVGDKSMLPATSVTFETGELEYIIEEIFWEKIHFLKNVKPLSSVSVKCIESDDFKLTKIMKDWHFKYLNDKSHLYRTFGVGSITAGDKKFAGLLKIIKYKQDWKTKVLEFEANVVPTGNLSFDFDFGGDVVERNLAFDIIELKKFKIF